MLRKLPAALGLPSAAACLLLAGCHVVIPYDSQTAVGDRPAEVGVDAAMDAGADARPDAATQQIARVPTVSPLRPLESSSGVNAQLLCGIVSLSVPLDVKGDTGTNEAACADLTVARAGYYRLSGPTLADTCTQQTDESGYLLIHNSCNPDGYPREAEGPGRPWIVRDGDNTLCVADQCPAGSSCVTGDSGTNCCKRDSMLYGTFWLEQDNNRVCLAHLCWLEDLAYRDRFVSEGGCVDANSIGLSARLVGTGGPSEFVACLDKSLEPLCP